MRLEQRVEEIVAQVGRLERMLAEMAMPAYAPAGPSPTPTAMHEPSLEMIFQAIHRAREVARASRGSTPVWTPTHSQVPSRSPSMHGD